MAARRRRDPPRPRVRAGLLGARRRGPTRHAPPRPRAVPAINHLRFPAAMSGAMLLVFFPLILVRADGNYVRATGHHVTGFAGRWLAITAGLFLASGLVTSSASGCHALKHPVRPSRDEDVARALVHRHRIRLAHGRPAPHDMRAPMSNELDELVAGRKGDEEPAADPIERDAIGTAGQAIAPRRLDAGPDRVDEQRTATGVDDVAGPALQARTWVGPTPAGARPMRRRVRVS